MRPGRSDRWQTLGFAPKDLTKDEASLVIDELDRRLLAESTPATDEEPTG